MLACLWAVTLRFSAAIGDGDLVRHRLDRGRSVRGTDVRWTRDHDSGMREARVCKSRLAVGTVRTHRVYIYYYLLHTYLPTGPLGLGGLGRPPRSPPLRAGPGRGLVSPARSRAAESVGGGKRDTSWAEIAREARGKGDGVDVVV